MIYVVYHDDMDGRCAADIVLRNRLLEDEVLIPAMYDTPLDWIEKVAKGDTVWVLDFCLPVGEFEKLYERVEGKVVWIDHHSTSIEKMEGTKLASTEGCRNITRAACVLAWKYTNPGAPIPLVVDLIGDRDIWQWEFGSTTAAFHAGALSRDTSPTSAFWSEVFKRGVDDVLKDGEAILAYVGQRNRELMKHLGFDTRLEHSGKTYKVRAVNVAHQGSETFGAEGWETGALPDDVDICCTFYWTGRMWSISFYSDPLKLDVGKIARDFGGGGHPGASGYQVEHLPDFLNLKSKQK